MRKLKVEDWTKPARRFVPVKLRVLKLTDSKPSEGWPLGLKEGVNPDERD